ncbi:conserved hypothetical protein [Thermotomaculum hydrothermale]|uniref:SPOR domain-containing protein n=1 Tax=Thermotomaculum hydrothermale TaxID=981385 RepID=A0A7R6SXZ2_9BACT|nr:SPOR domain-containing protein [Thermotomaculum hydrothermale]BBB32080.1 conserved hypothetical protein [Thermotomaculum hydrothermale]
MKEKLDSTTYLTIFAWSIICFLVAFFLGMWVGSKATLKPDRKPVERVNYNDDFNPQYEEFGEKPVVKPKTKSFNQETKIVKKESSTENKKKKNGVRENTGLKQPRKTAKTSSTSKSAKKKTVAKKSTQKNKKPTIKSGVEQRYMLQIGAYKKLKDANRLKQRFEKKGYSVFIVKERGRKSVFYKVRIGTFYSKKIAYKVKKKIEREDRIKAWVVPIK